MGDKLTICYEDFRRLAENLVEKSHLLKDGWSLKKWTGLNGRVEEENKAHVYYLVKKCTQQLETAWQSEDGNDSEGVMGENELDELAGDLTGLMEEEEDTASLAIGAGERVLDEAPQPTSGGGNTCVCLEYHVVHSVSYQVPILYFNAAYTNGHPLPLKDIWRLLSTKFVSSNTDKWGLVTQQEHPYLGRPFYHIHPCHTAEVMGKAMQCSEKRDDGDRRNNYLITWLSTFSLLIGLEFPIEYGES